MSATQNPQAAADQARDSYRDVTAQFGVLGLSTAIPEGVRALAEKTVATAITVPCYVNEHPSEIRAVKPGWYGMESNGKLSSGPFSNQGECLTGITEARSQFRESPWLEVIKCPECGGEQVRPCTRLDGYGRVWMDNSCETCGYKLSLEEISRNMSNK